MKGGLYVMEIKIVKVIHLDEKYKDVSGREHTQTNYYVVINGQYVAIRPSFKDGYSRLDLVADVVRNGK